MKVEELRNYGKGFVDARTDPEVMKRMGKIMSREFRRELGFINMIRLRWRMKKEIKRMKKHDWSKLNERGLTDEKFIHFVIRGMAAMKALADMLGMERASEIRQRVWDKTAYDVMASVFPSVEEFRACGDTFKCVKEYLKAFHIANERTGVYEAEVVEDTDDVFQCNYKYCVWHHVANEFGDASLCYPSSCYGDDAFWPRTGIEGGWQFKRAGTLATGAPVCDFRLERITGSGSK